MSFAEDRIKYQDVMELNPPASEQQIKNWEEKYQWKIPGEYRSFLLKYNGGEIYIPGLVLLGVEPVADWCDMAEQNSSACRGSFDVDYLVIGRTNYGNLIGIYTGTEQTVDTCNFVEWDTETQEAIKYWDTLEELLQREREIYVEWLNK